MSEENNGTSKPERSLLDELRKVRSEADKGREPELLTSRQGRRAYSSAALLERVVDEFIMEHGGGTPALQEADTEAKRLKLLLGAAEYVLAVESIQIDDSQKADLVRRAYTELFSYGPLDDLFVDERITTISLEGADKIAVRYGHGELVPLAPVFEDEAHLRKIVKRLLLEAGAELSEELPIIEAGLTVSGRRISINIAGPPVTILVSVDIRIHPADPVTLDDFVSNGVMSSEPAELIRALAQSENGFIIVGDTESGKTSLMSALAELAYQDGMTVCSVERAGELHLPEDALRYVVRWPSEGQTEITFSQQVEAALESSPQLILLDEVRTDESQAVYPLLMEENPPRQIWTFRGPASIKRLQSALGMVARRSTQDPSEQESLVQSLYKRLPFVITLRRRKEQLQLYSIGEWQYGDGAEYPDLVALMEIGWEGLEKTGRKPQHPINLPDSFWDK